MLRRAHEFVKPGGYLYVVLPLACLSKCVPCRIVDGRFPLMNCGLSFQLSIHGSRTLQFHSPDPRVVHGRSTRFGPSDPLAAPGRGGQSTEVASQAGQRRGGEEQFRRYSQVKAFWRDLHLSMLLYSCPLGKRNQKFGYFSDCSLLS